MKNPKFEELFKEFDAWYRSKYMEGPKKDDLEFFYLFLQEKGVIPDEPAT